MYPLFIVVKTLTRLIPAMNGIDKRAKTATFRHNYFNKFLYKLRYRINIAKVGFYLPTYPSFVP